MEQGVMGLGQEILTNSETFGQEPLIKTLLLRKQPPYDREYMCKGITILLITVLSASSLVMVGCAFSQSIPKPSAPDFTVKFADFYDVPPTYEVNPNTGETIIT
jgi:hypothetical protein